MVVTADIGAVLSKNVWGNKLYNCNILCVQYCFIHDYIGITKVIVNRDGVKCLLVAG